LNSGPRLRHWTDRGFRFADEKGFSVPQIIRSFDNRNQPIVHNDPRVPLIHFNLLRLDRGGRAESVVPGFETVLVVLRGKCDIEIEGRKFDSVGKRRDIWDGNADSVYAGTAKAAITALEDGTEVAVAGGRCEQKHPAFRITPEEVDMVDVGSPETHSRRRIFHILGNRHAARAGNLLVSELFCDDGCWSGYPAHKHDTDAPPEESCHEEMYHYRFNPENGFGCQLLFQEDGSSEGFMTRHGDTLLIDRGYHPTVTSPGHREYIFTILVGKTQRSLIQNFKADHRYLMDRIPGIAAMRAKFK
jgi:5-deoxy-glucuronate isomerase